MFLWSNKENYPRYPLLSGQLILTFKVPKMKLVELNLQTA